MKCRPITSPPPPPRGILPIQIGTDTFNATSHIDLQSQSHAARQASNPWQKLRYDKVGLLIILPTHSRVPLEC